MNGIEAPGGGQSGAIRTPVLLLLTLTFLFHIGSWNTRERILVVLAVPLLVWLFVRVSRAGWAAPSRPQILLFGALVMIYDIMLPRVVAHADVLYSRQTHVLLVNGAWLAIAAVLWVSRNNERPVAPALHCVILLVAGLSGVMLILNTPDPPLDVWVLHDQAGEALINAESPYTGLDVESSFDADADSKHIVGYSYTPPNLVGFGLTSALTGDSRWFSLACWLVFLGCVWRLGGPTSDPAFLWFIAIQPAWPLTLQMSYTESLTIMLVALALTSWKRWPVLGAITLGIALASKQYLIVLVPVVLLARHISLRERLTSLATAALAAGAGLVWGISEYWDAVVAFHGRVPPQASSVNLYGVTAAFDVPLVVPTLVGAGIAALIGGLLVRRAETPSDYLMVTAVTLAVGFFLAIQAFVNYWLLVACLSCLAVVMARAGGHGAPESPLAELGDAS